MKTSNLKNIMAHVVHYVGIVVASLMFVVAIASPSTAHAVDFNITATAGAGGSITPSGVVAVPETTDQSFTITPDLGYHVDDVLVDDSTVGAVTSYTFTGVAADHTIDASFAIDQFTITASAGAGGAISPNGGVAVDYGTDQTFTITPDTGFDVDYVLVDSLSIGATTTYTFTNVLAAHTIDATFSAIATATATHTVTATAGTNGTVTPSGVQTVDEGDDITFTITPDLGYDIDILTVDGATTTPTTTYTFTNVLAAHTIDATFSAIPVHTITAIVGSNGTITPSGVTTVLDGGSVALTITPNSGYALGTLIVDSVITTATSSYTFSGVTGDHTISATFIPTFDIIATTGSNGTISPSGTSTVTQGDDATFAITPDSGYAVDTVIIDGSVVSRTTSYTFTNVTATHTISVAFAPIHDVVATSGANGTISPSGTTTVTEGDDVTFTITPNSGYGIASLIVDSAPQSTSTSYTFTNVTADHTIDVAFVALHSVVVTGGSNGTVSGSGTTTVTEGSNFTVTITPDAGYAIGSVVIDGVPSGTSTTYTLTGVTSDHTIAVTFVPLHSVTVITGTNGSTTPSGTTDVPEGDDLTITITSDAGYTVGTLIVDSVSVSSTTVYTFTNVTSDHTLSVTFVPVHTLTITGGANGTVTPAGTTVVLEGSNQTVTITSDAGFGISLLLVDGVTTTPTTTVLFTNVMNDHTVDATFALVHDVVVSGGANGTVSPVGTTTVFEGSDVTVTITPDFGYGIDVLTVDGVTTTPTTTLTFTNVMADHTVDVTFVSLPIYTILATAGANGNISPAGSTTVTHGQNQTFTITPAYGYGVDVLTIDGVTTTPATSHTFVNVQGGHTIDVTFLLLPTHTILATAGANGTMSPLGTTTVIEGTNQMFFINPAFGYFINSLTVDGVAQPVAGVHTFVNVVGDHTISVTFAQLPIHTITASSGPNGAIIPSGTVSVYDTYDQTFTITPVYGYTVSSLTVDGVTTTPATSYTFTNVTGDHTISATFSILPTHTIVATTGLNGSITPSGTTTVPESYNQTFTITPDVGYSIAALLIDGATTTATTTYTFANVLASHTIDVTFVGLPTHTITASAGANGTISPSGLVTVFETYNQTFTITPDYGYGIAVLTVDGAPVATTTPYTFTNVLAAHTIGVTFFLLPTHTVTLSPGSGGTITGSSTVVEGESPTYTVTPDYGYGVGTLIVDGVTTTPTTTVTFSNVTTDHSIGVTFVPLPVHTITSSAGGNGSVSPLGATSVFETYNQTFTFTPSSGYAVDEIIVDGVPVASASSYTFTSVMGDHTLSVTFEKVSGGGGGGSSSGSRSKSSKSTPTTVAALELALLKAKLLLAQAMLDEAVRAGAKGSATTLTSTFYSGTGARGVATDTPRVNTNSSGILSEEFGDDEQDILLLDEIFKSMDSSDQGENEYERIGEKDEMNAFERFIAIILSFFAFLWGLVMRFFSFIFGFI